MGTFYSLWDFPLPHVDQVVLIDALELSLAFGSVDRRVLPIRNRDVRVGKCPYILFQLQDY
jgi:hypothetical protein